MTGVRVLLPSRWSGFCVLLIAATISIAFTCVSLAQSRSESQGSSRPRRTEDLPQATPTPPKKEEEVTLSSDEVVRVDTSLTNVFFTAADKQKRFISNIKREDVRVLEDGVPQEIFTFQPNSDLPLSLAILIDTSGSEERTLPEEKAAARAFLESVMRPAKDEAAVGNRLSPARRRSGMQSGPHRMNCSLTQPSISGEQSFC